jgi:hypothetical protein
MGQHRKPSRNRENSALDPGCQAGLRLYFAREFEEMAAVMEDGKKRTRVDQP